MIMGLKENQPDINNCTKEELTEALDGRIYTTLRFCNMEALDTMIKLLQDTKKMWKQIFIIENNFPCLDPYEKSIRILHERKSLTGGFLLF